MLFRSVSQSRYGATYYAARVSSIFPQAIFYNLFGVESGFLTLRILLTTAFALSFFKIIKNFFSESHAFILTPFIAFNPFLSRALAWDYIDGFSITYMMISIAFFINPTKTYYSIASGLFAAMAINSYLGAVGYLGAFFVSYALIFNSRWKQNALSQRFIFFGLGFLVFYFVTSVSLFIINKDWGLCFELKTLKVGLNLALGGAKTWWRPLQDYINTNQFNIFIPFVLLGLLIIKTCLEKRLQRITLFSPGEKIILLYLTFVCAGVLFQHNILKTSVLLIYAISLTLPASFLGFAALSRGCIQNCSWEKILLFIILTVTIQVSASQWLPICMKNKTFWAALVFLFLAITNLIFKQKALSCLIIGSLFTLFPQESRGLGQYFTFTKDTLIKGKNQVLETAVVEFGDNVVKKIEIYCPKANGETKVWINNFSSPLLCAISSMNLLAIVR